LNRRVAEAQRTAMKELTEKIIGASIEIHRALGPGLLESAYRECLCYELSQAGLFFKKEVPLPVVYKNVKLDCGYRLDIIIEDKLILELKAIEKLLPIHEAQLLTYLKITGLTLGLLINFNVPLLKDGVKRIANNYKE
jgi:GxxExxY protein